MCASGNRIGIIVVMGSFRFSRRMDSVIVLIRGTMKKRFQGKYYFLNTKLKIEGLVSRV